MIELVRVIEHQATLSSYRATQDEERAVQLELIIEMTKPKNTYQAWHQLIATSFRYSPPHREARFRPPYGKNVFYGALLEETALYEHSFHFMKQRLHLKMKTETGSRKIYYVEADDTHSIRIQDYPNHLQIMNKSDYSASHQFITANDAITFIVYPSCRDPKQRDNAAVLDINQLAKNPKWESTITFFYDNQSQQITWLDYGLHMTWSEVS